MTKLYDKGINTRIFASKIESDIFQLNSRALQLLCWHSIEELSCQPGRTESSKYPLLDTLIT